MHLPGLVQAAGEHAAGPQDRLAALSAETRPVLQPGIQRAPAFQRAGHQDGAAFAADLALAEEHRVQRRDFQLPITLDVAELTGEGRLAKRAQQTAGEVVALPLEVVDVAIHLQAVHAAPAAALPVRFVHRRDVELPQCVEIGQAVAFEQFLIGIGDEILHSRPSKKRAMWRTRFLSEAFNRSRRRYCR
ncbi:hypothetical protein D3C80_1439430 [compost metagenome]